MDGEAGERFAVDLGVDGILIERLADEGVGLEKFDAFGAAKFFKPERRQIAEIAQAALGAEGQDFEVVFEEIGFGGDFEGAAVVLGAADNGQRGVDFLIAADDAEMRKFVATNFAGAFPPVGENANAGFEAEVNGINNHAVGAGAADAEKISFLFGLFERSGEAESDFLDGAANEFFGGAGNVPGEIEFLGENVGGAAGEKRERDAMAVLMSGEAVDDFVERAVAAAGDDELAAFIGGLRSNFRGVAGAGGFGEIGLDAAGGKNMTSGVERAASSVAAVAGVGVVNQQSVLQVSGHSVPVVSGIGSGSV